MSLLLELEHSLNRGDTGNAVDVMMKKRRSRAAALKNFQSIKYKRCPGCNQGLRFWHFPDNTTLILCISCSWTKDVHHPMDESRALGETFIPGVTGERKGTPTAKIDSNGSFIILTDG